MVTHKPGAVWQWIGERSRFRHHVLPQREIRCPAAHVSATATP
jgi:hypothetical protein